MIMFLSLQVPSLAMTLLLYFCRVPSIVFVHTQAQLPNCNIRSKDIPKLYALRYVASQPQSTTSLGPRAQHHPIHNTQSKPRPVPSGRPSPNRQQASQHLSGSSNSALYYQSLRRSPFSIHRWFTSFQLRYQSSVRNSSRLGYWGGFQGFLYFLVSSRLAYSLVRHLKQPLCHASDSHSTV